MAFSFETDSKGYIKKRESFNLEYKQNFQLGDNLLKYIKTLVGMANNKGGQIVFGIKDSPHILLGMSNNKLSETDPKVIDIKVREYFSPDIRWQSAIQEFEGKKFGVLSVEEAEEKPVVCKKNKDDILREGAIYYRYRGETKEIEYPELKKILDKEREKERILWIKHIERIAMVGPQNIHLLDRFNGEITYGDSKILLDKSLIDQLKFIKEGHFTEKEGEGLPTLKLVGTIDGLVDVDNAIIDPNVAYPLTTGLLQKELGLNQYEMQAVIYSLDLKSKPKRHTLIMQGEKSNGIHKYSKSVVSVVQKLMEQRGKEEFLNECTGKYKKYIRETKEKNQRKRKKEIAMPHFNEHALELSIMELFRQEGYIYTNGEEIHKEVSDVLLRDDMRLYLRDRYKADGITPLEVESVLAKLTANVGFSLYEQNRHTYQLMTEGFSLKREDTALPDLFIEPIDFSKEGTKNNLFRIVNQLEIQGSERRIPDGIVYVNGLPVVVLEFKSAVKEDTTIMDAYTQLTVRYRRDIPDLFRYNAFVVISDGVNNKYGSLFSPYDFFYAWRKVEADDKATDGINSLLTMVQGLFRKERLLSVIKDFVFFPDSSKNEMKIVCRYPQFFATHKLFDNIRLHSKLREGGDGKGGTYFGATGCGKSITMLFLTRMLMKSKDFASPTIVLITDRTDLDDQLSKLFGTAKKFVNDDCVVEVESRDKLGEHLEGRTSGGVFLTTIHKFTESTGLLSERANIICISDEAHRSQTNLSLQIRQTDKGVRRNYGFAKYLHDSLPNATYVGFTGTPIDATIDVFGEVVDAYTMTESVTDEITRRIVYEGRAAKVLLDNKKLQEIEEYYKQCAEEGANEYQIEESKKAVTKMERILGDSDRLQAVAEDFIAHYEKRVEEGSTVEGKAMFVCSNRTIAFNLYKKIIALRPEWAKIPSEDAYEDRYMMAAEPRPLYGNQELPIEKIKLIMTRSKDDAPELYNLLGTDEDRRAWAEEFKKPKSNFKIAIVVDMWTTGFDVDCLDTMYIDKPLQQHTLVQTISRVNRVYPGKEKGLVVDYIGIKSNMNVALKRYAQGDANLDSVESIEQSVAMVKDELDIIRRMFGEFDYTKFSTGTPLEQLDCLNKGAEFMQRTKEQENLFMGHAKKLKSAFNLCSNSEEISDDEREEIHYFCGVRSIIYKLTIGDTPDISQMNRRVSEMIEEAIQSEGVEEIIQIGNDKENLDVLSEEYMERLGKLKLPNTKVKLMERLLKTVITEFKKVNKAKGVDFSKRLSALVDKYNERRDSAIFADEVLTEVANQMADLLKELNKEKKSFLDLGISYEEKAFYDILKSIAKQFGFEYPEDKLLKLAAEIKKIVADKSKYTDWSTRDDIKAELKMDLILVLAEYGYPPVTNDEVFKEILEQAENFKKYNG